MFLKIAVKWPSNTIKNKSKKVPKSRNCPQPLADSETSTIHPTTVLRAHFKSRFLFCFCDKTQAGLET